MEVLFHFIFQLFKIAILASVYSIVLVGMLLIIERFKTTAFLRRVKLAKKKYWFHFGFYFSILLFVFSFSYWGNHGLGDGPKIPIGHWETIENTNWTEYAYLENHETRNGIKLEMTKFLVEDDKLCGNLQSWFYVYNSEFFILDLKTDQIIEFSSIVDYNKCANENNLPQVEELLSFQANYSNHWSGIRFWLLP